MIKASLVRLAVDKLARLRLAERNRCAVRGFECNLYNLLKPLWIDNNVKSKIGLPMFVKK